MGKHRAAVASGGPTAEATAVLSRLATDGQTVRTLVPVENRALAPSAATLLAQHALRFLGTPLTLLLGTCVFFGILFLFLW